MTTVDQGMIDEAVEWGICKGLNTERCRKALHLVTKGNTDLAKEILPDEEWETFRQNYFNFCYKELRDVMGIDESKQEFEEKYGVTIEDEDSEPGEEPEEEPEGKPEKEKKKEKKKEESTSAEKPTTKEVVTSVKGKENVEEMKKEIDELYESP